MEYQLKNLRYQDNSIIADNPEKYFGLNDYVLIGHPRYTEGSECTDPIDLYQAYQEYRRISMAEAVRRWKKGLHVIVQGSETNPTFLRRKRLRDNYPGLMCCIVETVNLDKPMVKLIPLRQTKDWLVEAIINNNTGTCLFSNAFKEGDVAPKAP